MRQDQDNAFVKSYILSFLALAVMAVISFKIGISEEPQPYYTASTKDLTEDERIRPIGQVAIKKSGADAMMEKTTQNTAASAESTYQSTCFACHGTGVLEAPKLGDAAAWKPRIDQGMEVLLQHATNGFNAMPARGGNPTLTDDQIKDIIEYMLSKSQ